MSVRTFFVFWRIRAELKLKGFYPVLARLERRLPGTRRVLARQKVLNTVERVSRELVFGDNCLIRSLTALSLLKRHGHPAHLRIGVKKAAGGTVSAHAWLDLGDGVSFGELDSSFHPMSHS